MACKKCKCEEPEMKWTNIHDVNSFACKENEIYLSGKNEYGEDITIVLNTIEILESFDMVHIKDEAIKYITQLNE
tara:strand:- start:386 stop:610 length:225 start_codon:yes stop_codon:yes gene_type:complete